MNTQAFSKHSPRQNQNSRPVYLNPTRENMSNNKHGRSLRLDKQAALTLMRTLRQQREHIARDLHDGIGSQLTHIISRLDLLAHSNTTLEDQLNDLRDFTRETVQQLRETIWILNQPVIVYGQLSERIRGLLTRISTDSDQPTIRFTAYGDATTQLPPAMASSIFRIVQEGVNNAMKYADCTELSVCLATDHDSLTILISDNGKGFSPDEVTPGYGLLNFKKRSEELHGNFTISSSIDGTEILVDLPLSSSIKYVK